MGHAISQIWTLGVALIMALAGACFAVLSPPTFLDPNTAKVATLLGIVGTCLVAVWFGKLSRRAPSWDGLGARRNVVLLVICLAWLFGAVGGLAVFYVIPRFPG